MEDREINEKLAEVMGKPYKAKYESGLGEPIFSYKDPAIFYECLEWLLENLPDRVIMLIRKELRFDPTRAKKAVAMARIEAER